MHCALLRVDAIQYVVASWCCQAACAWMLVGPGCKSGPACAAVVVAYPLLVGLRACVCLFGTDPDHEYYYYYY